MDSEKISGGISGAITNPDGEEEIKWASKEYEKIRKDKYDVSRLVKNLDGKYSEEEIAGVKRYLFLEKHDLGDRIDYFDPDVAIAQSWLRLSSNHPECILPHDRLLIDHEIFEMRVQVDRGISQDEAHIIATIIYNYELESNKYYLERRRKYGNIKRNSNSGRFNKS